VAGHIESVEFGTVPGQEKKSVLSDAVAGRWSKKRRYYAAAAVVILLACVLWIGQRSFSHAPLQPSLPLEYSRSSNPGERKSFQLADGTKVMLNAGSRMRISTDFNEKSRELTLEGEAFFDVAKDAQRPFIIRTSSMDIKVLGTTFNVKAYPADNIAEASLLNGSVEVMVKGPDSQKIILRPSEKIIIPNTPGSDLPVIPARKNNNAGAAQKFRIEKLSFSPAENFPAEVSWTENRLAFNDESFSEIAVKLERWYNVSIRFEDEPVGEFRFTATFDKKTIEQVLDALAASRPFEYRREEENKMVISKKGVKN
jgi:ferric-dicitrate binding protein FerR (iron transport regulator)